MSRSALLASGCFIALVVLNGPAAGQVTVEAGLGAAGASTGATAARNLSEGISVALRNLDNAVRPAGSASASKTHSPATSGAAKSAPAIQRKRAGKAAPQPEGAAPAILPPPQRYEDAAGIEKGIEYEELVGRFGPPLMEFAGGDGAKSMSYVSNSGAVQVEFRGGKVTSVEKPKS